MVLYLRSPYTHQDENVQYRRYQMAVRAATRLMTAQIAVLPPLSVAMPSIEQGLKLSHEEFLELDLQLLRRCDEVLVLALPDWTESVGVKKEIFEALKRKMPIDIQNLKPSDLVRMLNSTGFGAVLTESRFWRHLLFAVVGRLFAGD